MAKKNKKSKYEGKPFAFIVETKDPRVSKRIITVTVFSKGGYGRVEVDTKGDLDVNRVPDIEEIDFSSPRKEIKKRICKSLAKKENSMWSFIEYDTQYLPKQDLSQLVLINALRKYAGLKIFRPKIVKPGTVQFYKFKINNILKYMKNYAIRGADETEICNHFLRCEGEDYKGSVLEETVRKFKAIELANLKYLDNKTYQETESHIDQECQKIRKTIQKRANNKANTLESKV